MENTLAAMYYFFQSYFNLLMTLEVVPGVTVGGILISVLIIGMIFGGLGLYGSKGE